MVEMMWQPKNHEISNPAPGVFPKLSWVVWTHFWWFRVHIWAQNWAQTRKIRKYLKIWPNEMWWKKCLLIIKNAWDFGYLRDFPREFEWRIENWHFWKFVIVNWRNARHTARSTAATAVYVIVSARVGLARGGWVCRCFTEDYTVILGEYIVFCTYSMLKQCTYNSLKIHLL